MRGLRWVVANPIWTALAIVACELIGAAGWYAYHYILD